LFAGDTTALFAAILNCPVRRTHAARPPDEPDEQGEATVASGKLLVAGRDVAQGDHLTSIGAAPLDPPLPASWTAEEYVGLSARLGGMRRRAARDLAEASLARVGARGWGRRLVGGLTVPERRVLVLAHAIVASPSLLVAEAPLQGLEGPGAALVTQAIAGAS